MAKEKWYREGLAFECTQCGACCSGAEGYVWVDQAEIDAMARCMEMDVEQFEKKFVRKVGNKRSLVEYPDGDCVFLEPKDTAMHGVRGETHSMPYLAILG